MLLFRSSDYCRTVSARSRQPTSLQLEHGRRSGTERPQTDKVSSPFEGYSQGSSLPRAREKNLPFLSPKNTAVTLKPPVATNHRFKTGRSGYSRPARRWEASSFRYEREKGEERRRKGKAKAFYTAMQIVWHQDWLFGQSSEVIQRQYTTPLFSEVLYSRHDGFQRLHHT